jgi:hypothetical protein
MPTDATPADHFLKRLDAVERRLEAHARSEPPTGLTDPDPPTGEQWDAGQVWSHLAEILYYWNREAKQLAATRSTEPVPFGRVKSNPGRIAAVEEHRHDAPPTNMDRLRPAIVELRQFLQTGGPEIWELRGLHEARGVMSMERIMDEFMVGHLEEHADQLDGLVQRRAAGQELRRA